MRQFEVSIPEGCTPSNLGFAAALVDHINQYTSDEVSLKIADKAYINAKSILGLLTFRYEANQTLSFMVIGENENYTASNLEYFVKKLIKLYTKD